MGSTRRRKAPRVRLETLDELVAEAREALTQMGRARYPAVRWLGPGRLLAPHCLPRAEDYDLAARDIVGAACLVQGWIWRWEGGDLVLELPGWEAPAPRIQAVQPGLFD